MIDRLQYIFFHWLWTYWHMRFRQFFDSLTPTEYGDMGGWRLPYAKYVITSRPWWHLCCNGDNGGWRTKVCDYLEYKWRYTKFYDREG